MSWDFLTGLEDWILALAMPNSELLAPIAFGLGFAESIVVLSWFVPSSAILLGLGAVQQATGGEFWTVWIAASRGLSWRHGVICRRPPLQVECRAHVAIFRSADVVGENPACVSAVGRHRYYRIEIPGPY
jgi:hypothetical protein